MGLLRRFGFTFQGEMQRKLLISIASSSRSSSSKLSAHRSLSTTSSYGKVDDLFLSRLSGLCGHTSTNKDIRYLHGNDESSTKAVPPDVVAFPKDTETVQVCFLQASLNF
jgi:hypothetical protein